MDITPFVVFSGLGNSMVNAENSSDLRQIDENLAKTLPRKREGHV